jgi:hypothetical protein
VVVFSLSQRSIVQENHLPDNLIERDAQLLGPIHPVLTEELLLLVLG